MLGYNLQRASDKGSQRIKSDTQAYMTLREGTGVILPGGWLGGSENGCVHIRILVGMTLREGVF